MPQRKMLEEDGRRAIQQRATETLPPSDDVDEAAFVHRFQNAADVHPSDLFDVGTADGLAVRDDGKRLERGRRQASRPGRELRAFDGLGVLGPCEDLPAAADLDQLDTVPLDVVVLA